MTEQLKEIGYAGGYDAVRRYAQRWRQEHAAESAAAFVPQIYAPGEAYQFDWSHEIVILDGVTTEVGGSTQQKVEGGRRGKDGC